MFTSIQSKLLSLNLSAFPLMAAASASIKGCPTCPHKVVNKNSILHAAAVRMRNNKDFKAFLKQHFKLPIMIGGVLFED